MEAGWIEFAVPDSERPAMTIHSLARAGDRGFWLVHEVLPVGRWIQTDMWATVLESAARIGGVGTPERVMVTTIELHDDSSDEFHVA